MLEHAASNVVLWRKILLFDCNSKQKNHYLGDFLYFGLGSIIIWGHLENRLIGNCPIVIGLCTPQHEI